MDSNHWFRRILPIFLAAAAFAASPDNQPQPPKFRLPATATPERYQVRLTVIPDQDTFSGAIDIDLNFRESTAMLWLNAEKLNMKDADLVTAGRTMPARIMAEPHDFVGFAFDHPVGPGRARLHVNFDGHIGRKDMAGIFQVEDGHHWYVYSQFENISARRAFPCFDEPGYKVPWQVTLTVPADDRAFSNTSVTSEVPDKAGMKTVVFRETKPLPSYLVAIAVGPMEVVDAGKAGANNTSIRIVVPRGRSSEARFAATATPTILNLLERYFGIPYPYDKLDEVAIPYASYAMEHPGLVTYGTLFLLVKPDAPLGLQRVATSVMSHELSHQWFGDLVTMKWWDDTWLNEGFASWMANKIVNQYHPEWNMDIDELNAYQKAMSTDELVSARKVRQEIVSNDDIDNAFDGITYDKGSGLLNMFESYVGEAKFQQGIQRYLRKFAWKNATSAEFLQELSGNNAALTQSFSSFLNQAGVPLITIKLQCDQGGEKLQLSQERFRPLGSGSPTPQSWDIPLCVRYPAGAAQARECILVTKKSQSLNLSKTQACPAWVYANADEAGYYRVRYEKSLLGGLGQNEQDLTLKERVGFLGNISAVSKGGLPLGEVMSLLPSFAEDQNAEVVSKAVELVGNLDDHLVPDSLKPNYRRYLSDLFKRRSEALGWKDKPDDSPQIRLLRPQLDLLMANHAEEPEFIAAARKLALRWLADHKAVDQDMLSAVLQSAAAHGDRTLFNDMRAAAKKEADELVQFVILHALGQFRTPELERDSMALVLGEEFATHQSLSAALGVGPFAPGDRDVAYDFIKQNWDALMVKLPTDTGAFLPRVASIYCDEQHRADAQNFFAGRSTNCTGGPRNLDQVLESIRICEENKNANQSSVAEFLRNY